MTDPDNDFLELKPAPDRRVRKPGGTLLDAGGERVPDTAYWQRRLADEDVVAAAPAKKGSKTE